MTTITGGVHNLKPYSLVVIRGVREADLNGCFTVRSVESATSYTTRPGWWRRNRIKHGRRHPWQRYEVRIA